MKNSHISRIVALILAVVTLGSGTAVLIGKITSKNEETEPSASSIESTDASSEQVSSAPETVSLPDVSETEDHTFTLSDLYTSNIAQSVLSENKSVQTTVTLYLPEEQVYHYTRYLEKDEGGEIYFHYRNDDGQEQLIQRDNIFFSDDGESIQFQVAYNPEYEDEILPYVLSTNPYYYEPAEEVRSCYEKDGLLYLETGIDLSLDEYYQNNWGYTEGIADCSYVIESDSLIIRSITLSLNGEKMMETAVDLNGSDFSSDIIEKIAEDENRKEITVYYDYGAEDETVYHYSVPSVAGFYYSQPEGFTMYLDPDGTEKMTEASPDDERLSADSVSLYLIRDKEE